MHPSRTRSRLRIVPPAGPALPARSFNLDSLSPREQQIIALVAQGYQNRAIAQKVVSSEQTVKNHLHNVFKKLGISDRLELALYISYTGWRPRA